ncbi:hypothetical protein [Nonomuraea sp. NPDC049709]|uniref:hypothetical protein n=1 Tax=Nonomuraea sp. NPDC049709 TaxID=3154736 RepID=UPI003447DB89
MPAGVWYGVAWGLRNVLDHVEGPEILVEHSYDGLAISVAGADDPRSRRWCTWPPSCLPRVRPP